MVEYYDLSGNETDFIYHNGAFLHPTINGQTYYDKPVGSYWLIVAASYLTGDVDETAARLPAAAAGWLPHTSPQDGRQRGCRRAVVGSPHRHPKQRMIRGPKAAPAGEAPANDNSGGTAS